MRVLGLMLGLLLLSIVLEIIGKKTDNHQIRTTVLLQYVSSFLSSIGEAFGYYYNKLSDIVGFLTNFIDFVFEYIKPHWIEFQHIVYEVVHDWGTLLFSPFQGFMSGYSQGMENAYNKIATMIVSIVWGVFGTLLGGIMMEIVGIVRNTPRCRPSIFITWLAQIIYNEFHFIGYIYTRMCDFMGFFTRILDHFGLHLKPFLEKSNVAISEICYSLQGLMFAPFIGLYDGVIYAFTVINGYLRPTTALIMLCTLVVIVGGYYYYYY